MHGCILVHPEMLRAVLVGKHLRGSGYGVGVMAEEEDEGVMEAAENFHFLLLGKLVCLAEKSFS